MIAEFLLDQDPEISGHHATFLWDLQEDCLKIRDEGSFNGTALNFKLLKKGVLYPVKSGSSLCAGKSTFIITIRDKETDNSKDSPDDKEATCIVKDCYCPICFKDLSRMSEIGRTQHVNHCLPEPSHAPSRSDALSKASSLLRHPDYEYPSSPSLSQLPVCRRAAFPQEAYGGRQSQTRSFPFSPSPPPSSTTKPSKPPTTENARQT